MFIPPHGFAALVSRDRSMQSALADIVDGHHAAAVLAGAADALAAATAGCVVDQTLLFDAQKGSVPVLGSPCGGAVGGALWLRAELSYSYVPTPERQAHYAARVLDGRVLASVIWYDADTVPTWSCEYSDGVRTCVTPAEPGGVELTWLADASVLRAQTQDGAYAYRGAAQHLPASIAQAELCVNRALLASRGAFTDLCYEQDVDEFARDLALWVNQPTAGVDLGWARGGVWKWVTWTKGAALGWAPVLRGPAMVMRHWSEDGVRDTKWRRIRTGSRGPLVEVFALGPNLAWLPEPGKEP